MPEDQNIKFRTRLKQYIAANKTVISCTITAAVTATAVAGLQKSALKEAYDFIDAAGLMDKFIDSVPYDEIHT
jgi:hypothetical protein